MFYIPFLNKCVKWKKFKQVWSWTDKEMKAEAVGNSWISEKLSRPHNFWQEAKIDI